MCQSSWSAFQRWVCSLQTITGKRRRKTMIFAGFGCWLESFLILFSTGISMNQLSRELAFFLSDLKPEDAAFVKKTLGLSSVDDVLLQTVHYKKWRKESPFQASASHCGCFPWRPWNSIVCACGICAIMQNLGSVCNYWWWRQWWLCFSVSKLLF